jgi:hypothetical protein
VCSSTTLSFHLQHKLPIHFSLLLASYTEKLLKHFELLPAPCLTAISPSTLLAPALSGQPENAATPVREWIRKLWTSLTSRPSDTCNYQNCQEMVKIKEFEFGTCKITLHLEKTCDKRKCVYICGHEYRSLSPRYPYLRYWFRPACITWIWRSWTVGRCATVERREIKDQNWTLVFERRKHNRWRCWTQDVTASRYCVFVFVMSAGQLYKYTKPTQRVTSTSFPIQYICAWKLIMIRVARLTTPMNHLLGFNSSRCRGELPIQSKLDWRLGWRLIPVS